METNPYLTRVWHRRGEQPTLPAAGTNRRLTVFGSVEVFGRGRVEVVGAGQDSASFGRYLAALDARHTATGKEIFLALDNGPCHTSDVSRAALAARAAWLHVIWLAKYSPQLNRKEREWRVLKRDARGHLAPSLRAFVDGILQGLRQLGDTAWAETFTSGDAIRGSAGTGSFGLIQSGALESSNVDLTQQLVNMITAQRNFQANAQMISTADQVTQTIINIR